MPVVIGQLGAHSADYYIYTGSLAVPEFICIHAECDVTVAAKGLICEVPCGYDFRCDMVVWCVYIVRGGSGRVSFNAAFSRRTQR